jgi:hypothetical protein
LGIKSSGKVLLVPQFENDYYSMLPKIINYGI